MTRKKTTPVEQPQDTQVTEETQVSQDAPEVQEQAADTPELTVALGSVIKPGVYKTATGATLIRN